MRKSDTTARSAAASPTGNSSQSHAVYGRIRAGQDTLKAGSCSDTMTLPVAYIP